MCNKSCHADFTFRPSGRDLNLGIRKSEREVLKPGARFVLALKWVPVNSQNYLTYLPGPLRQPDRRIYSASRQLQKRGNRDLGTQIPAARGQVPGWKFEKLVSPFVSLLLFPLSVFFLVLRFSAALPLRSKVLRVSCFPSYFTSSVTRYCTFSFKFCAF